MAEYSSPDGGQPQVMNIHPEAALVESQNAKRLARRRQAAALALQVQQVAGEDLDRFGERRQVGGTFEDLQEVPQGTPMNSGNLQFSDLIAFLQGLSFAPQNKTLSSTSYFSSFAPGVIGLNNP